ncbi:hypothetical protein KY495_22915 [Massilia sp. PAMC28688]|uniref:hypothetical protein n=1 Tax=Massilia sp. PAMC28688 TaxID=2861283 RepID=UPI001C633BA6|nr:hypothetical protein [Massilia sp. PAMC28688]QYF93480.1 hypothetical protein KY495_22915 [Massilia sp. PAMC28688]
MMNRDFLVFGMGMGADHLHYIGCTERALGDQAGIVSDLTNSSRGDIAQWVRQAGDSGAISIFEIESAPSLENARESAQFWCQYYKLLGARVVSDLS